MTVHTVSIPFPGELLLSLKETPESFAAEARLLLAVKLYELGRITTGMAARIAGMGRVAFFFALKRFKVSPIGTAPEELSEDARNA